MKDDIFYKSININNYSYALKPLKVKFQKSSFASSQIDTKKVEFRNTITKASESNLFSDDLFDDHFSFGFDKPKKSFKLSMFIDNSLYPDELLLESNQSVLEEQNSFLDYFKTLNFFGYLKQKKDKTLYLDIDDYFIKLITNSLDKNISKEKDFFIPIIPKEEYEKKEVLPILEIGQKFQFKIKSLSSALVNQEDRSERVWFLEIESKDLESLRYRYHLSPTINSNNFFIKLGSKAIFKLKKSFPKMKINLSFFAA